MTLLQFSSFLKCAPKGMCARSSLTISSLSRPGKTRVLSSTQQVYSSDKVQRTECELAEPETPPRLNCFAFLKKLPRRWNALFVKFRLSDFFLFYILSWFLAYQALYWDFPGLVVHLLGLQSSGRSIGHFSWRLDHMYVMPKIVRREPYCRAKFEASTLSINRRCSTLLHC